MSDVTLISFIYASLISVASLIAVVIVKVLGIDRMDIKLQLALASGVFIGIAFIGALPMVIESGEEFYSISVFLGFMTFTLVELVLGYHEHHHLHGTHLGIMGISSDILHNFIDGVFIYTAFALDPLLGILVSLATLLHELPQEVSDFIILLRAGLGFSKAVAVNLLVSGSTFLGIILASIVPIDPIFIAGFMAGNYIYIAAVDLIPDISKGVKGFERLKTYIVFLFGIGLIYGLHLLMG